LPTSRPSESDGQAAAVLVATDLSDGTEEVLRTAIRLAHALAWPVELVHVEEPLPVRATPFPTTEQREALQQWIRDNLEDRRRLVLAAGVPCGSAHLSGDPAAQITARARAVGAGLVVMGLCQRNGTREAPGAVTARVLSRAPCPVVVVPPAP
jgi:nucleotide-binding universal stress UspA family protein